MCRTYSPNSVSCELKLGWTVLYLASPVCPHAGVPPAPAPSASRELSRDVRCLCSPLCPHRHDLKGADGRRRHRIHTPSCSPGCPVRRLRALTITLATTLAATTETPRIPRVSPASFVQMSTSPDPFVESTLPVTRSTLAHWDSRQFLTLVGG